MNRSLRAMIGRAADPRLISGIYNYCNSRCERCRFTERCLTYIDNREREARHPDKGAIDDVAESMTDAMALIQAWCEEEGLDFGEIQRLGAEHSANARADETASRDPLQQLASTYSAAAFKIMNALQQSAPFHARGAEVRQALDAIAWNMTMIPAKIGRAIGGWARHLTDDLEWDEVQNDWNGSAKVARLAIAESIASWLTVIGEAQAPADSPIRQLPALLERIDAGLAERFPRAMDFVRPGFDEPEVAAGALTSLAPFDPRR
jgi:hypothetical protein